MQSAVASKRIGAVILSLVKSGGRCKVSSRVPSLTPQCLQNHSDLLPTWSSVSSISRSVCSQADNGDRSRSEGRGAGGKRDEEGAIPFYDIVIAGGGMTGRAMACALGLEADLDHYKILMIEGSNPLQPLPDDLPDEYSNRVCALNHASIDLLTSIGAWTHMVNHRVQPIRSMQVWDACSDSSISFRNQEETSQELAYIVENDVTVDALSRQLEKLVNRVKIQYNSTVQDIKVPSQNVPEQESWVQIKLANGKSIKTRLLIGADGPNSLIRTLSDVPMIQWQYDQSAVVATLRLSESTDNVVAWQRFLPTGPIAMLPLTNELSSLVWSTNHSEAESLLLMNEEQFVDEVNNAFWDDSMKIEAATTVGQLFNSVLSVVKPSGSAVRQLPPSVASISPGSRAKFPLSLGHASHYVKPRIALIGDAAHRVHPMAGQGVNLGFGDVACLRDTLVSAASMGKDLGCQSHLLEYETSRQRNIIPVVAAIDSLKRLYSTDNPAVVIARSLGLQATNALEPLKQQIISLATGR
ncbi:ubiquinone biosynthesis monooxygenase COQ6, mitochondrial-like [Asterias amurensis]|uniref:ubiquinone biosynthesis monooxygenase COQ6, mitochondrial-like n=1 Tax=Asterias amurensis TaxID=7602 RepID=UPI003AB58BE9